MFCGTEYSDETGSSMKLSTSWGVQNPDRETVWSGIHSRAIRPIQKAASVLDLMMQGMTMTSQNAMEEFRRNGSDSPYDPDSQPAPRATGPLSGMGPSSTYLRQWSCPLPAPAPPPPVPRPSWPPRADEEHILPPPSGFGNAPEVSRATSELDILMEEQRRALSSLAMYSLIKDLGQTRGDHTRGQHSPPPLERPKNFNPEECKFCKNNGETETVCRSHVLKDARGRVRCPILRAYVCRRCGAQGDNAHTIKYCPYSTVDDRRASVALMRSLRRSSGNRRYSSYTPAAADFVVFGEASTTMLEDNNIYMYGDQPMRYQDNQLDPLWAEVERRLML